MIQELEKIRLITISSTIISQIDKILILDLDTQEKRNKNHVIIFSWNCPMCKIYFKNSICDKNCFLSNQQQYGCTYLCTKPKNKFNSDQLKLRKQFWLKILNFIETNTDDSIFLLENREKLQKIIIDIDDKFANQKQPELNETSNINN